MRKSFMAVAAVLALSAAAEANAVIVFNNAARQDFQTSRGAGSSPVAAITVSSTQFLNQIGVSLDPTGNANLKFVVFNLDTQALLFSTGPVSFADVGSGFYLSPTFTPFTLTPGINYGIGAVADVAGLWGTNNSSSGNPFSQGGFTASDDRNGNVTSYAPPTLAAGGDGAAMIIVELGVAAVPEPASAALLLAGLAVAGGVAARRRRGTGASESPDA